ncbi:hypothetical protein POM88_030388 [Heracleum sosnowskyi]|uniref:Uncharacterized protein n=1 Tax=Heracleum sosnowskyi TaxID=360622 RepID=A0AAD8HVU4_9APIA|nr:hypothetical protein POM88_030388 [Heracleum sosnowskyi]
MQVASVGRLVTPRSSGDYAYMEHSDEEDMDHKIEDDNMYCTYDENLVSSAIHPNVGIGHSKSTSGTNSMIFIHLEDLMEVQIASFEGTREITGIETLPTECFPLIMAKLKQSKIIGSAVHSSRDCAFKIYWN